MSKHFQCDVCGTLINSETGENFVSKDSNAYKIETMKEQYEKLQGDLKRALDENQKLIERIKHGKVENENNEELGDGDGDGSDEGNKGIWDES